MPFRERMRGFWRYFLVFFLTKMRAFLADWSVQSPNSVHKHVIFVQDFPESLIANEPLNRSIHDAVGQNTSGIPRIWNYCEFSDRHYIREGPSQDGTDTHTLDGSTGSRMGTPLRRPDAHALGPVRCSRPHSDPRVLHIHNPGTQTCAMWPAVPVGMSAQTAGLAGVRCHHIENEKAFVSQHLYQLGGSSFQQNPVQPRFLAPREIKLLDCAPETLAKTAIWGV